MVDKNGKSLPMGLQNGDPHAYIVLLHAILCDCSTAFSKRLVDQGYFLTSKQDDRFVEAVFKMLSSQFNFRPHISVSQFMHPSRFVDQKLATTNAILERVIGFEKEAGRKKRKVGKRASSVSRYHLPEAPQSRQS